MKEPRVAWWLKIKTAILTNELLECYVAIRVYIFISSIIYGPSNFTFRFSLHFSFFFVRSIAFHAKM